jgi:hypothetical protein
VIGTAQDFADTSPERPVRLVAAMRSHLQTRQQGSHLDEPEFVALRLGQETGANARKQLLDDRRASIPDICGVECWS